ncbi:MAG: hypothetical protein ACI84C_001060 [Flavobacteriales bacterium]|jgi:hypothetical protein
MIPLIKFTQHSNLTKFGNAFALCLSLFIVQGCTPSNSSKEDLSTLPFFDLPDKLWAHRANDLGHAQTSVAKFSGLEFDIFFDQTRLKFTVRHDADDEASLELGDYLDAVLLGNKAYAWIDFKNFDQVDHQLAVALLKDKIAQRELLSRVIVESWDQGAIKKLHNAGFNTSYWLPHFEDRSSTDTARIKKAIQEMLATDAVNALSADQSMYEFLDLNFPEFPLHLWTNGLEGEPGKKRIRQLAADSQVKVILVDYDENILQQSNQ